ncbi:hypothetical protein MVEN_00607400 [Mycena venus]|uniref:Hydroxyneurosporene synthase n=1 Tax=Mycena venus TaxID=2733690 RepID=A0A8H6YPQ9_9AGAR|nr:hypothetical protein MVEN_00607400 [Mycena venus]
MARTHPPSLAGALWTILAAVLLVQAKVFHIPAAVHKGASTAEFRSSASGLDGPKVHSINSSAFDWCLHSPLLDRSDSVVVASIMVSFPNGTLWDATSNGNGATVTVDGDSSSGTWHETGFSWIGSPASGYLIKIDAPHVNVKGTITFSPVAPAHYPCGPVAAGQKLEVGPHIGWANAIPDANSAVNLHIDGTNLAFKGSGYHDKNWSDQPFTTHVASWYWGHGRVGPYSIVWFDFLDLKGTEFVSAYASKNDKIVAASCTPRSIKVRPTGPNATYPPVLSSPNPSGYHISLDLGAREGSLEIDVTVLANLVDVNPEYARLLGNMSAELVPPTGRKKYFTGMALFDQFKLTQ